MSSRDGDTPRAAWEESESDSSASRLASRSPVSNLFRIVSNARQSSSSDMSDISPASSNENDANSAAAPNRRGAARGRNRGFLSGFRYTVYTTVRSPSPSLSPSPSPSLSPSPSPTPSPTPSPDSEPIAKAARIEAAEGTDEVGLNCPICFDPWGNAGEHRLVSLKCGHLFGNSCIVKWIKQQKVCPTCKTKASPRHIRCIYAKQVGCVDNSEMEAVRRELEKEKEEKKRKDVELQQMAQAQATYVAKIDELTSVIQSYAYPDYSLPVKWKFSLEKNMEVSADNGCRVFAHSPATDSLVFSLPMPNGLFSGYAVRQLRTDYKALGRIVVAHNREIRCMQYSCENRLLMTASFDKTIGLIDLNGDKKVMNIPALGPLWSCCWDRENAKRLYAGTSTGRIVQFDLRQSKTPLMEMPADSDLSPVISLACVPGGLISCQLNSLKAHAWHLVSYRTSLVAQRGPYLDMNYDWDSNKAVVSTRPNSQSPNCKHLLYDINMLDERDRKMNIVHEYEGSSKQTFMTKVSQFEYRGERLLAVYDECESAVRVWNTVRHTAAPRIISSDGIIDTCSWSRGGDVYLSTLSTNRIRSYKIVQDPN